ncbi:MAG: AbrB/MazE/SpoVT family DNA-binding domain-containing protein [Thermoplasmatales archaeon]|nr:AbrB/MazE/SpoVT family DNA-binding domain-containing protein [Thermoplasmatales archaeon]
MEIRRVQKTGGSSYVITLPKEWIKSSNIKKNDPLGMINQSDGTLVITPKMIEKKQESIKFFKVDDKTNQKYFLRQLVGAYIAGYNSIEIRSKERMPISIRTSIGKFTQITIGQEVIEETDTLIIIKDLLKPAEMPFNSTIKRMHLIVKSMHEDAMNALQTGNKKIAEEILSRDNDVDRLHWLVARQHNIIIQNLGLLEKMNITIAITSTYFLISKIIERMGDHVVRISQNILNLMDKNLDKRITEKIKTASDQAINTLNKSVGAFFRKDISASNKNIEAMKKLEKLCEEINEMALKQKGEIAISIGYIVESIRRIGEYAEDISETTINYLILEEK